MLQAPGEEGCEGSVRLHLRTPKPALPEAKGTCTFVSAEKTMAVGLRTSVPEGSEVKANKVAPRGSELTEQAERE